MQDKIFYGKSTHGSEEIKAVLNQLKKIYPDGRKCTVI